MGDPQTPAIGVNVSSSSSNLLPPGHLLAERSSSQLRGERPAINAVLARLRRRIRGYVLLEGVALLCIVCGVLFWLTLALDWAYRRLTAPELPRGFRGAVPCAAVVLGVDGLMFLIVLRYFARLRD